MFMSPHFSSLKEAVGSSDEDEGNFLTQRKKSKEELVSLTAAVPCLVECWKFALVL